LSPQLSSRGSATSKKCKLANSIQNITTTTKAGTQLRLIIVIITIYTNNNKLHKAQIGNHSVCTWLSEKEKNKGLVAPSENERGIL
jgi:hypothetical protein